MSEQISFTIDDVEVKAQAGQTILEAADAAGVYIPRLCAMQGLTPAGACRVCVVKVNGRIQTACTQPVAPGIVVENETEELTEHRRMIVEMLFVEGNHFCMFCEKSGNCELQAMAYRLGITHPRFPYQFPQREMDFSHPDIYIDHNRCILCGRCVRTSREADGKSLFEFVNRGPEKQLAVNRERLANSAANVADQAVQACPVGALMPKRVGYNVPVGERKYDHKPIGTEIESGTQV
jgi:[NiFe] hydrogenase diaphorase moiety small subunit